MFGVQLINQIETDAGPVSAANLETVRATLQAAGVAFDEDGGVRMREGK
jgi:hypothetical protein